MEFTVSKKTVNRVDTPFAARLEFLIAGKNTYQWAAQVGLSRGGFHKLWRKGVTPQRQTIEKIVAATGCSQDWLAYGRGDPFPGVTFTPPDASVPALAPDLSAAEAARERSALAWLPLYQIAKPSDQNDFLRGKSAPASMAFDDTWLRSHVAGDVGHLAAFTVYGDNMKPTLCDGDLAIVNRSQTAVSSGIYVFALDNQLFVQRLERRKEGVFAVSETDPQASHHLEDLHEFAPPTGIVGRVVWYGRKL